jgi:hypothetical protein
MLEDILVLLGIAAGAIVLIAFWGIHPLDMRRHRGPGR